MTGLLKQILSFLFVSGIGWCMDFGIYFCLTSFQDFPVFTANCISAVPAVMWVFWFSSKKIFAARQSALKLHHKYLIYFAYQVFLIIGISVIAGYMYLWFMSRELTAYQLLRDSSKMMIKVIITPVTMTMNFIVMKILVEKL